MILLIFIGLYFGPIGISAAMLLYSIYVLFMNTQPNKKFLDYALREQVNDIKAGLLLSIIMGILVFLIGLMISNIYMALVVQVAFGAMFYIGMSELFKPEAYSYARNTIMTKLKDSFIRK